MRRSEHAYILVILVLLTAFAPRCRAQFRSEAFTNGFGGDDVAPADSAESFFSVRNYFAGIRHKQELSIGRLALGSAVVIGGEQIYNRQYWKLPIIYGGLGATLGGGIYFNNQYKASQKAFDEAFALNPETTLTVDMHAKRMSSYMFAGSALIYWGALMDGVVAYPSDNPHDPGKAMMYSLLLPGLGQAYNGEYWKIPFYWGCLAGAVHYYDVNQTNYKRFKRIHNEATSPDSGYSESISAQTALYYRDLYRRYRDYSVLAIAAFYLLQVIDANVFSYMQDFEVSDDISMQIRPAVLAPDNSYALSGGGSTAVGFSLGLKF